MRTNYYWQSVSISKTSQLRVIGNYSFWFDTISNAYSTQIEHRMWTMEFEGSNTHLQYNLFLVLRELSLWTRTLPSMSFLAPNLISFIQSRTLVRAHTDINCPSSAKLASRMSKYASTTILQMGGGASDWHIDHTNHHFDSFLLSFIGRSKIVKKKISRRKKSRRKISRVFLTYVRQYRKLTINRIARFPFSTLIFSKTRVRGLSWGMTRRVALTKLISSRSNRNFSYHHLRHLQLALLNKRQEHKIQLKGGVNRLQLKWFKSKSNSNWPNWANLPIKLSRGENVALISLYGKNFLTNTEATAIWFQKWLTGESIHLLIGNFEKGVSGGRLISSNLTPVDTGRFARHLFLTSEAWRGRFRLSDVSPFSHFCSRFLEFLFNRRSCLSISSILWQKFSMEEAIRCRLWIRKLRNFSKVLGKGFFLADTVRVMYRAFRMKDPHLLINWFVNTFKKISFWKYRSFFHFLRYFCRFFLWPTFKELGVKGVRFKLKGKISVSGNARTRTISTSTGVNNFSSYNDRVLHAMRLIPSFTGVMGFQLWLIF